MRAILTDLDRTLTGADLILDKGVVARMRELRERGIRVVVVTGRTLDYLVHIGLHHETDALVAENGAVVACPPASILEVGDTAWQEKAIAALGTLASSFAWGRVLGSGPRKAAAEASAALTRGGVPHVLSYNAEEVMILPAGVDKASGARRALEALGLQEENAWAIGDGENDVPLLRFAGFAAVPSNAHPAAREEADVCLEQEYSAAFLELTARMMRA